MPKPDSLLDRMKKLALWKWGAIFIFVGVFQNLAGTLIIDAGDMRRAEERATRLGVACAGGLAILAGIILIVLHFVRRKRK